MKHNIFEGHLVRLRSFREEDAEVLFEHHGSDTVAERLAGAPEFPRSRKVFADLVARNLDHSFSDDNKHLAVESLDGVFVGHVVSSSAYRRMGSFGFGIHLFRPHWRQGYGTEATLLFLRFFFMELGYHCCNSSCWEFNAASLALHLKVGFRECGRYRERVYHNGKRYDEILFDMTRDDFMSCSQPLPEVVVP